MFQNWSFLATVVDYLNRLPTKQHGTNVMRIRPLYVVLTFKFFSLICLSVQQPIYARISKKSSYV